MIIIKIIMTILTIIINSDNEIKEAVVIIDFVSCSCRESPEGAYLARSLEDAIKISGSESLADSVEGLFIIGGASIYQVTQSQPRLCFILFFKPRAKLIHASKLNCHDSWIVEESKKMVVLLILPNAKYKYEPFTKII